MGKEPVRGDVCACKAQERGLAKVGKEHACAAEEGKHVHVVVGAAVVPVHKSGLWGHAHLVEEAFDSKACHPVRSLVAKIFLHEGVDMPENKLWRVGTASGTKGSILLAEQTATLGVAEISPRYALACGVQNVHVEDAGKGKGFLYGNKKPFEA